MGPKESPGLFRLGAEAGTGRKGNSSKFKEHDNRLMTPGSHEYESNGSCPSKMLTIAARILGGGNSAQDNSAQDNSAQDNSAQDMDHIDTVALF